MVSVRVMFLFMGLYLIFNLLSVLFAGNDNYLMTAVFGIVPLWFYRMEVWENMKISLWIQLPCIAVAFLDVVEASGWQGQYSYILVVVISLLLRYGKMKKLWEFDFAPLMMYGFAIVIVAFLIFVQMQINPSPFSYGLLASFASLAIKDQVRNVGCVPWPLLVFSYSLYRFLFHWLVNGIDDWKNIFRECYLGIPIFVAVIAMVIIAQRASILVVHCSNMSCKSFQQINGTNFKPQVCIGVCFAIVSLFFYYSEYWINLEENEWKENEGLLDGVSVGVIYTEVVVEGSTQ